MRKGTRGIPSCALIHTSWDWERLITGKMIGGMFAVAVRLAMTERKKGNKIAKLFCSTIVSMIL